MNYKLKLVLIGQSEVCDIRACDSISRAMAYMENMPLVLITGHM